MSEGLKEQPGGWCVARAASPEDGGRGRVSEHRISRLRGGPGSLCIGKPLENFEHQKGKF